MPTSAQLRFGLLGPLTVRVDDVDVFVPPRMRAVLGGLLVRANTVISPMSLTELAAGEDHRIVSSATIRSYVKQLRQALGPAAGARIVTRDGGYVAEVLDEELDVLRFESLFRAGGAAASAGAWRRASELLGEGLSLWRGTPFGDLSAPVLHKESARLEEMRLQALEWRIEADLNLARHGVLVPELQVLALAHPFREQFHAQLMLGLFRCGRQAEALAAYQAVRKGLVDDLGIEPGPGLRQLHQRILVGDVSLACVPVAGASGSPDPALAASAKSVIPRQLPAEPRFFTGRSCELEALTGTLDHPGEAAPTVAVTVVCGIPGVGKTTLAVHWAHQVAARFPDGQLYVNLRGFDPSGSPLTSAHAIRGFLEALDVPAAAVPADFDSQAALYRSMLAGKRVLVLLDNAKDAEQVRPLLPGGSGCAVVITSRNPMAGLIAAEGAHLVRLQPLDPDQARDLLLRRVGRHAGPGGEQAAGELIDLCGRLPLALGIAAARAVAVPGMSLRILATELREARSRLDLLCAPGAVDSADNVRAVFGWSYRTLTDQAARMFRLLGTYPGPDIDTLAAASLAGLAADHARLMLAELTAAQLLTEHGPDRFALHDLLRAYSAEQALAKDSEADRKAALERLLDYYLHTAHRSVRLLNLGPSAVVVPPPAPGTTPAQLVTSSAAMTWFAAEVRAIIGVVEAAWQAGFDRHAWQLPLALKDLFSRSAHGSDLFRALQVAVMATRRLGDQEAEARILRCIGDAHITLHESEQAEGYLNQAMALYRTLGHQMGEGGCLFSLFLMCDARQDHATGLRYGLEMLRVVRSIGDKRGEAWALNAVGWSYAKLGDCGPAHAHCSKALAAFREAGNPLGEGVTLDSLGYVQNQLGRPAEAVALYQEAIVKYREIDERYCHAETLLNLGDAYEAAADTAAAREAWQDALVVLNEVRHPIAQRVSARLERLSSTRCDPP